MRFAKGLLFAVPLAALLSAPALAQGGGMMGGGMMGGGMMGGRMGQGPMMGMGGMTVDPTERIEGRLAFLHAELGITEAQEPAWSAFAQAARNSAASMAGMHRAMMSLDGPPPLPERLELMEGMMTARLDAIRRLRAALVPLYESFSPDQRETADSIMGMM